MNTYRFRIVLDVEEDVLCDLDVPANDSNLFKLHQSILKAFELEEGEMASFYRSNNNWDQGEEIGLVEMGMPGELTMSKISLHEAFPQKGTKMIYVYDLIQLWTFFVELIDVNKNPLEDAFVVRQTGRRPDNAPPKKMESHSDVDIDLSQWDILLNDSDSDDDLS